MLKCLGVLTVGDLFEYKNDVRVRPELAGYDELVDLSEVQEIVMQSIRPLMEAARFAADLDVDSPRAKVAIFAPTDLMFGMGRVYVAHRNMADTATKDVEVFRVLAAAMTFLGIKAPLPDENGLPIVLNGGRSATP